MSDLAPFVAASLRDKVVDDLLEENKQLRAQLNANITSSRKVLVSGLNGEIFAEGRLDEGGDVGSFFFVNLKAGGAQCSTMEQFHAIELHVGDLYNTYLSDHASPTRIQAFGENFVRNFADNATPIHFGHFEVYNPETRRADISFST
jgi:hypothetical protein